MAIVQQYPLNTPKNSDLLVGTSTPDPNTNDNPKTSNFSVGSIGSFLIAENNIITGGGTPNTIAMFTPDGTAVGDSVIVQDIAGSRIDINAGTVINANAGITGNLDVSLAATFEGDVSLGEGLKDASDSYGANKQILTSTGTQTSWRDFSTLVPNNITGSGTVEYIPRFTPDGQIIGDSIINQKPNGLEIQVGTGGGAQQTTIGTTYVSAGSIGADVVTATNINGGNTGNVILSGGVVIGNEATDILQITSAVSDYTGSSSTSAGQVLASTAAGQLSWSSINAISEIKSEKITVSTAELRNLHTTPKILIDVTAGNPKEICQVYSVIFGIGGNNQLNNLVFPNDINIESDVASPWKYVIPQSVANEQAIIDPYYNPSLTAGRIGLDSDVILSSAGAAVETGTATTTMTVWITYRIFNIAD